MSMREVPCSGNLVIASELTKLLSVELQGEYVSAIDNQDWEEAECILSDHLPSTFPRPSSVFVVNEEDSNEEMEAGEMYVSFDDDELYVKTKTPELVMLESAGIQPKFQQWTVFC